MERVLEIGWIFLIPNEINWKKEIFEGDSRRAPVLGIYNLISGHNFIDGPPRPEVFRVNAQQKFGLEYPWRVRFFGYRSKGQVGYYTPEILFRTEGEARGCVFTINLWRTA